MVLVSPWVVLAATDTPALAISVMEAVQASMNEVAELALAAVKHTSF